MSIFVFDIETVPDIENGRKLLNLQDESDSEVADAMFAQRLEATGSEFLQLHLHRIVAISAVLRTENRLKVWSLGSSESPEKELVERFFGGLEKFTPTLVSWNGNGFDLPVLNYRALLHSVMAKRYWEVGDSEQSFRWNNYINRYHYRHIDLMDILACYQGRANAPLDQIATMMDLPGKMGMDGSKVWEHYKEGKIEEIRNYCETDVLNTYLVYLRFELMRGKFTHEEYEAECQRMRDMLEMAGSPHLTEFLQKWK